MTADIMIGIFDPAAFGRLCVETEIWEAEMEISKPAAFGRLCVETIFSLAMMSTIRPAAFGRLCVETGLNGHSSMYTLASRLRAAVC